MKKFFNFGKNRKESSDSSRSNRGSVVSRNGSVVSLSSVTQATAGGYDVREKDLGKLHKAVLQGDIAKIQSLVRKENINGFDKQKRTALHFACAIGSADAVKELLSWKANVNLGDNEAKTPLIKAVECNHPECTTLLLNAKADPKTKDKEGNTVLHYAARFGYHDVMTLLLDVLDKGREEDLQYLNVKNNNGLSPLHIAVHNHQNITCSDLLEHDVDVNVVDKKGNTPLMIACELGHTDLVDMLLEYDADSSKKNLEGWTAEDIAQRKGNEQCSKRIAEYQSQPPGSTPRVATSVQAAGDDEDDDDDNDDAGANANKGQQAAGGDETDSWQDSDSEQPTVHSQQLKKNLSLNSPRQDDSAVNNLAYTIGDISAELDEPQANKSQAGPLNNLSHANVRHDIDPGYETVKVAGNSQKPSIHSLDNDEKTPSIPFLASSLGASGDHDNFTDQVQIPQSARSTLTGRSWLSDSKWSDEEDDNEDSLAGPAFVNPGAIPKTSASANMLLNNNNSNNATKAPKTTNLSAANAMAELNKNDNNNQPNGVNSKKKVDNNQLSVDDMGLEDVDSFNDNSALKPLDSARSNASDWDSSISDGVGIGAGARGIMANKGDLTGSNIATSVGKPMAQINEKSESDSKWDSDDDDIQEIPTIPSVAPPPVSAVVNMKEPIYSSVQKTSFHSKPPPVPPPPVPQFNVLEMDEKSESDEEEESTWETDRKAAKHSQSELTNAGTSKPKMEKSKILNSDRNPSPAPSTQSLHGDPVSLDANLNNVMRLQDHLRETQKKLDDTRNQLLSFEHKCKALEEDRSQLQQKLDNISRERMALEQTKIDLEAKLRNLEYKLSEEQRRKENAELLCEKIKDQASHKEEHIKKLMETNQKLEVQLADARKGHVKELDELKALSSSSQEPELYAVQLQLERAKELHKDEIDRLQYEIDELKKEKAELEFKFNCGEDALTHSKLSSSMELNAVKLEADRLMTGFTKEKEDRDKLDAMVSSLRSQLSSVEADLRTEQSSKKELERQMQHQTDQWRRSLEQREDELMRSQTTVQNQSVQLADLLGKITELESKLQITNANLTERMNQLSNVQRNLDEKRASYETLDDNWRKEKETNIRLTAKVESLEEKLTDAVQEVQRLKSNADPGKVSTDKLTSLLNDMKEDRDKTKLEMQQKNSLLTEAVNQAKADLRSVERDKASLEDEKRRMQTQLTNLQHQLTSTETSIESGNQQRQQLMAESQQLNRQIDVLKERLEEERRRASSAEAKLSGVTDKLKNSEKIVSTTAERLNQESSSLLSISKSKRELEESLHRMELEKTKLEVFLDAERQKVTLLQREYNDAKLAQKTIVDDFSKIKASNAQLQCLMNEAAGLRQQATQEADDNRALWESEIKSRSKLGLRIAQLEREKQEVLNHLNEEKRKARKAMEGKRTMETKLSQEEQRSSQMEKEIITLRTHLKNAKKRMKLDDARQRIQQDIGETGHFMFASSPDPMLYSMPSGVNDGLRQGSVDGLHHAGVNGHFASDSLKTYQLQMNLPGNYMERPDLQKLKAELEAKAQKELDDKLEEVNAYLIEQTKARERLDRIRDTNEMEIRKEFDRMKKELLDEVVRLKSGVQRDNIVHNKDAINRHTKESEQQMRELHESEQRLRQLLTSRLDHAMDKASRTPTFADQRHAFENDGSLDESIRMQLNQSISRHLDVSTTPFARNVSPSNVGETGGVDYSPPLQLSHLA